MCVLIAWVSLLCVLCVCICGCGCECVCGCGCVYPPSHHSHSSILTTTLLPSTPPLHLSYRYMLPRPSQQPHLLSPMGSRTRHQRRGIVVNRQALPSSGGVFAQLQRQALDEADKQAATAHASFVLELRALMPLSESDLSRKYDQALEGIVVARQAHAARFGNLPSPPTPTVHLRPSLEALRVENQKASELYCEAAVAAMKDMLDAKQGCALLHLALREGKSLSFWEANTTMRVWHADTDARFFSNLLRPQLKGPAAAATQQHFDLWIDDQAAVVKRQQELDSQRKEQEARLLEAAKKTEELKRQHEEAQRLEEEQRKQRVIEEENRRLEKVAEDQRLAEERKRLDLEAQLERQRVQRAHEAAIAENMRQNEQRLSEMRARQESERRAAEIQQRKGTEIPRDMQLMFGRTHY